MLTMANHEGDWTPFAVKSSKSTEILDELSHEGSPTPGGLRGFFIGDERTLLTHLRQQEKNSIVITTG
jgi:hypothetical protein